MTAILFYANYDDNSTSIIRTDCICPVTNLAYANTFVTNLITNLSQRPMLWTIDQILPFRWRPFCSWMRQCIT